jgi:hypothetical protein
MVHSNTKYWSLTWDTNVKQKQLPSEDALLGFFDKHAEDCLFQFEKGDKRQKLHIQGVFTLLGSRQSKLSVLHLFQKTFKNVHGLTLSPVYDRMAINAYVTKERGRVKGPFYGGRLNMHQLEMSTATLQEWQQTLFDILIGEEQSSLRDRKVLWVQDSHGNTGKSWFQKWLRLGQKQLTTRALPISSVGRLLSAVNILHRKVQVDAFTIDLPRTNGEDQSYKDLFSAIEQIKNGYVVDTMYGKYNEALFTPPMIIIFTNEDFKSFEHYLSADRWQPYLIGPSKDLFTVNRDSGGNITYSPIQRKK